MFYELWAIFHTFNVNYDWIWDDKNPKNVYKNTH